MKKVLGLLFFTSSLFAMNLDMVKFEEKSNTHNRAKLCIVKAVDRLYVAPQSIFVPNHLGSLELSHSKKGFYVHKEGEKRLIKKYHTDPMVRDLTREQLQSFLAVGYVCLNQIDNGEYSLKANGRINGGGPLLGTAMYWVTKTLCYAVPVAAVSSIVVVTGGAAGAAVGAGTAAAGTAITGTAAATTVGATISTTAGVVTAGAATATAVGGGVTVAAGAITGAGLATEAAIVTTAAVSSAGSVAATIVAIEAVSTAVGTFFGMLPTP